MFLSIFYTVPCDVLYLFLCCKY